MSNGEARSKNRGRGRLSHKKVEVAVLAEMSGNEELKSSLTEDETDLPGSDLTVSTNTKLFSGLNALGWSAGVAALTALATCAGMIREAGRSSALALYSLSRPTIDQRDTYLGMRSLLAAALFSLLPFAIAYLIGRSAKSALGKTSLYSWFDTCWAKAHRYLPWVALLVALVDVGFLNASIVRLADEAEGAILKHTSEAGPVWTEILLDDELTEASGYMFLFGAGLALFVGISWWLIEKRIEKRLSRIALAFWAGTQVLFLLFGFSYLLGVIDTIGEYPIVSFSGASQLAPHSCSVLLGSDDKQFAVLVVDCQEKSEGLQKYVLYLPRTEVKWMAVTRVTQLQPLARLDDLKKLSE